MTPDTSPVAPSAPPAEAAGIVKFTGRRRPLLGLLLKNLVLTVLTLGIYRFWAKTDVRRFFWSHTYVLDDPLEYVGTGKELLFGFLVALLFLVPLGLAYSLISAVVSPVPSIERVVLELGYFLVLLLLIQVAVYRIWRYRLSRTLWRGIRFGLDGSSLGYAVISMGWLFLTVVTLGIAYPWRVVALWRYRLNHTRFGTTTMHFEARALTLLPLWLACLAAPVAGIAIAALGDATDQAALAIAGVVAAVVGGGLLFVLFRVRAARLVVNGTRLGDVTFSGRLPAGPILGAAVVVIGALVAIVAGIGMPSFTSFVSAAERAQIDGLQPQLLDSGAIGLIAAILALTVALPMLSTLVLQVATVRALAASTAVDRPDLLEQTAQSTDQGPSYGEGLADAFDVGAI